MSQIATRIPGGHFTPNEVLDLYADKVIDALRQGKSVKRTTLLMANTSAPAVAWAAANEGFEIHGIAFYKLKGPQKAPLAFEMMEELSPDPCIDQVYRTIDYFSEALEPLDAVLRIVSLQGNLGQAFTYASQRVTALLGQSPNLPHKVLDRQIEPWLEEATLLDRAGRKDESLDLLFDNIDEMLLNSRFDACNQLLDSARADELSNPQLLTILTATLRARDKLPSRAQFADSVRSLLRSRGADADRLLAGLE